MKKTKFSRELLLKIYEEIKDDVLTEITPEYYFHLVNNQDEFGLAEALTFEILNRKCHSYSDMTGLYSSPQRIGLFANTYLIESSCVNVKINPFNLYKFPVKFSYGDDTHETIRPDGGNYAPDLKYTSTGNSKVSISIEIKSFDGALNSDVLQKYCFKDTKTNFPYNADFLILFNRTTYTYYMVGRDIEYYNFNTKTKSAIDIATIPECQKFNVVKFVPGKDINNNDVLKKLENDFLVYPLDLSIKQNLHDVHSIEWNQDWCDWASDIADELNIEPNITHRKNY